MNKLKNSSNIKYFLIIIIIFILISIGFFYYNHYFDSSSTLKNCGDGIPYGECSSKKPYYCDSGILVEKASICGCPSGQKLSGDSCFSEYKTKPKQVQLKYTLRGNEDYINFIAYDGFVDYLSELPKIIHTTKKENSTIKDFKLRNIYQEEQRELIFPLVTKIQNLAPNSKIDQARITISLVQHIPYEISNKTTSFYGTEIPASRYPYEVLYDGKGICGEKTELLALLLKEIGYSTAIFYYSEENHEVLGIKCPLDQSFRNSGYCFIETTGPSIITDDEINYASGLKLTSNPQIIKISEGDSLPDGIYEYKDSETWKKIKEDIKKTGQLNIYHSWKKKNLIKKYGLVEIYQA